MGSTCGIVWCLSTCKNQLHPSLLSRDIAKILNCYYGYLRHSWLWPVKTILTACRKLYLHDVYLNAKNHVYPLPLFWNITKILHSCYFGLFGHAWPRPPKEVALTCRKIWCLSANKKSTSSLNFFTDIITL